jgi:hypothetical protein
MNYQSATFRILVDGMVQVEVSIRGCSRDSEAVTPMQLRDAGRTMDRIGRAVKRIQRQLDHERGKRASMEAAVAVTV